MKGSNDKLFVSKKNKNNEFYTKYSDIEEMMALYKEELKDKVVYCNCDDYRVSNFVKYFINNFSFLGIKELISTNYDETKEERAIDIFNVDDYEPKDEAFCLRIKSVKEGLDYSDLDEILKDENNSLTKLKGTGSYSSKECIEILKECDIVITNPPFIQISLIFNILYKYNKDYIIIAPNTCLLVEACIKHIIKKELFVVSGKIQKFDTDEGEKRVNAYWVSNILKTEKLKDIEYKDYDLNDCDEYLYHNNIIKILETSDLPSYYSDEDIFAVPISFLENNFYNKFKIVGSTNYDGDFRRKDLISERGKMYFTRFFLMCLDNDKNLY